MHKQKGERNRLRKVKKQTKGRRDLLQDTKAYAESVLHVLVSLYMVLMIAVLPFYFTEGYARIGTDKYEFFFRVSKVTGILIVPVLVGYLVLCGVMYRRRPQKQQEELELFGEMSLTDKLALGYGAVVMLSYLASEYRQMTPYGSALKGTNQWYMGLISQLVFVGIYFMVSRFWKGNQWLPVLFLPVNLVVFVLGCLNRFGEWPIEMSDASPGFISTIGNINWYCGYIVIVLFGALGYSWAHTSHNRFLRMGLSVWLSVGFATLLTQGSQSGILTMGVVFFVLYLLSMKSPPRLYAFGDCVLCLGLACVGTGFFRTQYEERLNYTDYFMDLFTISPVAVVILMIGFFFGTLLPCLQKKGMLLSKRMFETAGYILCGLLGVSACLFVLLGIWNTGSPNGLGVLAENKWFLFDEAWGSGRGATWKAAVWCYGDLDPMGKLLGVGPDCMAMYIHEGRNKEILAMVQENFGKLILTNAHCEWLNVLVNCGLFGLITYAGMMLSAMIRFLKVRDTCPWAAACGFALLAYIVHNMVGFQQTMSAVTVFLFMGMGEAYIRRGRKPD